MLQQPEPGRGACRRGSLEMVCIDSGVVAIVRAANANTNTCSVPNAVLPAIYTLLSQQLCEVGTGVNLVFQRKELRSGHSVMIYLFKTLQLIMSLFLNPLQTL